MPATDGFNKFLSKIKEPFRRRGSQSEDGATPSKPEPETPQPEPSASSASPTAPTAVENPSPLKHNGQREGRVSVSGDGRNMRRSSVGSEPRSSVKSRASGTNPTTSVTQEVPEVPQKVLDDFMFMQSKEYRQQNRGSAAVPDAADATPASSVSTEHGGGTLGDSQANRYHGVIMVTPTTNPLNSKAMSSKVVQPFEVLSTIVDNRNSNSVRVSNPGIVPGTKDAALDDVQYDFLYMQLDEYKKTQQPPSTSECRRSTKTNTTTSASNSAHGTLKRSLSAPGNGGLQAEDPEKGSADNAAFEPPTRASISSTQPAALQRGPMPGIQRSRPGSRLGSDESFRPRSRGGSGELVMPGGPARTAKSRHGSSDFPYSGPGNRSRQGSDDLVRRASSRRASGDLPPFTSRGSGDLLGVPGASGYTPTTPSKLGDVAGRAVQRRGSGDLIPSKSVRRRMNPNVQKRLSTPLTGRGGSLDMQDAFQALPEQPVIGSADLPVSAFLRNSQSAVVTNKLALSSSFLAPPPIAASNGPRKSQEMLKSLAPMSLQNKPGLRPPSQTLSQSGTSPGVSREVSREIMNALRDEFMYMSSDEYVNKKGAV
ncbi:hypothetical protein HDU96_001812 [Phlyctochytrium bullatum]|nr:hypothetical protein HDU96_001812 [Phlyctochytrium bullatum]